MNINIRTEEEKDYKTTEKIVKKAFYDVGNSDKKEYILVSKLRKSNAFIAELSIVAEFDDEIVGYVMLTKIIIKNDEDIFDSLALAPIVVLPEFQNMGVGSKLINKSLEIAKDIGYGSVIVLGHDKYYPKFGFNTASNFNIKAPFPVEDKYFMVIELNKGALDNINGEVIYSKPFLE